MSENARMQLQLFSVSQPQCDLCFSFVLQI
jgi:hypothetical protein